MDCFEVQLGLFVPNIGFPHCFFLRIPFSLPLTHWLSLLTHYDFLDYLLAFFYLVPHSNDSGVIRKQRPC